MWPEGLKVFGALQCELRNHSVVISISFVRKFVYGVCHAIAFGMHAAHVMSDMIWYGATIGTCVRVCVCTRNSGWIAKWLDVVSGAVVATTT